MQTIIRKWFVDLEKEEAWLNEMCEQGLALVSFHLGKYTFEPCEPGKYLYGIERLGTKSKQEKEDYLQFLEDSSVELVCESLGWAFFRMENDGRKFELFTTASSKVQHYKRIFATYILIGIFNFFIVLQGTHQGPYLFKSGDIIISLPFVLNLPCGILMVICAYKYYEKIRKLKMEQGIIEG